MTAPELKPCPFCGSEAEFHRIGDRRVSTIIGCTHCGALLENGETFNHGLAWNTRAPDPDLDAHIGAVLEQAAECAYNLRREDWASEDEDWDAGTHDAAVAITALRPTALTALDRAKREARAEALEQAAAVAKEIANQYVGYMGRIERAIRALTPSDARSALRAHTEAAVMRALEAAVTACEDWWVTAGNDREAYDEGLTESAMDRIRALDPAQFIGGNND